MLFQLTEFYKGLESYLILKLRRRDINHNSGNSLAKCWWGSRFFSSFSPCLDFLIHGGLGKLIVWVEGFQTTQWDRGLKVYICDGELFDWRVLWPRALVSRVPKIMCFAWASAPTGWCYGWCLFVTVPCTVNLTLKLATSANDFVCLQDETVMHLFSPDQLYVMEQVRMFQLLFLLVQRLETIQV